jgi:hypothetical protein
MVRVAAAQVILHGMVRLDAPSAASRTIMRSSVSLGWRASVSARSV